MGDLRARRIALSGLAAAAFADRAGWRIIFAVDAVLLAFGLITAMAIPQTRGPQHDERRVSAGALRAAAPLSVAFFCFALVFLALAGLLPAWLVERRGLPADEAGRIVAIAAAFGIAGSLLAGRLMRRGASPGRLVAVGLIASTVIAALSFNAAAPVPLAVAGFAVCFALGGLVPAAAFASVPQVATDRRAVGPVNGLLAQTGSLGSLAGPPALALWVEATDWSLAPVMLVAVAAIGAACALAVKRA